jgi:hypothetical protein
MGRIGFNVNIESNGDLLHLREFKCELSIILFSEISFATELDTLLLFKMNLFRLFWGIQQPGFIV